MKAPKAEPREQTPEGVHQAVCIKVIDWGTQSGSYQGKPTKRRMLNVGFEITGPGMKTEKGDPYVNYKTYTFSVGKKANLAKDIKAWLGVKDLAEYDFDGLLSKRAMVTISHKESEDGNVYANITNISGLPKGIKEYKSSEPLQSFFLDADNYGLEEFNALGDYDKNKIAASEEYPEWKAAVEAKSNKGKSKETAKKGKK